MYIEFKEGEKFAVPHAPVAEQCDGFRDAGYIIPENEIVVDIDDLNPKQIDAFIKYFEIKTQIVRTERGIHLYYRKPQGVWKISEGIAPVGFKCEYKQTKNPNKPLAITIKRNGKMRQIANMGVRDELPDFLKASTKRGVRYTDFAKQAMDEGDGRNNALYKHHKLISSLKERKQIVNYINKYLLVTPLTDKEIANIVSDENVDKNAVDESTISRALINKFNIVRFKSRLWYYEANQYHELPTDADTLSWIVRYAPFGQKPRFYTDIQKLMEMYAPKIDNPMGGFPVTFKNGFIHDGLFTPIMMREFTPYYIDIEYKPDAPPVQAIHDYLEHITQGEKEYQQVICELLGYCLMTDEIKGNGNLCKFFLIVGGGGNGKGTLLSIIRKILGSKNCTASKIHDLPNDRHLTPMVGTLANLGDDIVDKAVNPYAMSTLKNITSGDVIPVRPLFKEVSYHRITATQIFTSNHKVPFSEYGDSLKRRLIMLPMYAKVENKDAYFVQKLTTKSALEYWLRLAVEGYMRLFTTGHFTHSETIELFNATELENGNPALEFIEQLELSDVENHMVSEISNNFKQYCEMNDLECTIRQLKDAITEQFGLRESRTTINKVSGRFYVKPKRTQTK